MTPPLPLNDNPNEPTFLCDRSSDGGHACHWQTLWDGGFFGGGRAVNSAFGAEEGLAQERSRAAAAMGKLRRLLMRAQPSAGEAALLRGALQNMVTPKDRAAPRE